MNRLYEYLTIGFICSVIGIPGGFSQLKVITAPYQQMVNGELMSFPAGTEDLSGTTVSTDELTFIDQFMEIDLYFVNESDSTMNLRCQRTEVDVVSGTEHGLHWLFTGFPDLMTGTQPVYIVGDNGNEWVETVAPGDTIVTFGMHYIPMGMSGISCFRIDILDEVGESVTHVILKFDPSALSVEDLIRDMEIGLAPNPANDHLDLRIEGVDVPVDVRVTDLSGKQVSAHSLVPMTTQVERINTADMRNGVYFLSILAEGQVIRTSKFVVSH